MMDKRCYNPDIKLLTVSASPDLHEWWNMADLAAPFWRLYWNDAPGAFIKHEGKTFALGPEKITLIAPETHYSSSCPGHARQLYIHFLAAAPYADIPPEIFELPVDATWAAHLARTLKAASEGPENGPLKSLLALRAIAFGLEQMPGHLLGAGRIDHRIAAALESMAQGNRQKSNEELAKQARMSVNAFLRLFRQNTGASPQLYGRRRRVEEACMLLQYSQLDIKDIAGRTGFCDRYHFSRIFKSVMGVSPAEFRRGRQL